MTDQQLDPIWNLINALSDRIVNLERDTAELRFRADKAEKEIKGLIHWVSHD